MINTKTVMTMKHSLQTTPCQWMIVPLLLVMALLPIQLGAQDIFRTFTLVTHPNNQEWDEFVTQAVASDLAARQAPTKQLSTSKYLLDEDNTQYWTNGVYLFSSSYSPEDRKVYFEPMFTSDATINNKLMVAPLNVDKKTKKVYMSDRIGTVVKVEKVGNHIMLVGYANTGTVMALYNVPRDMVQDNRWTLCALYPLLGCYSIAGNDEDHAVFGPRMNFYSASEYSSDPGLIEAYRLNTDEQSIDIVYGSSRVSRGDPSDPRWGKMPGGGGAAAIMGPMMWNLKPCTEGLLATVIHDEPFVPHMPSIGHEGNTTLLTKLECPFEGVPGKWAFASVIPMNDLLLKLYPTHVLQRMREEMYARHGAIFVDADTQAYFDRQPWYHRTQPTYAVALTPVESFNLSLIINILSTMR